jgi:hypothetical protein
MLRGAVYGQNVMREITVDIGVKCSKVSERTNVHDEERSGGHL